MKAVGLSNKSNSVSPIRMTNNSGTKMVNKLSKPGPDMSYQHPRNQSAMDTISPNDSTNMTGIRGSNSSAMIGVNSSNILGNGSAQRKQGESLNNTQNLESLIQGSKKIAAARGSLGSHRSNSSNVSNGI